MMEPAPMKFDSPLRQGTLIKRYKRFLADVRFDDGAEETVHVANSGSMLGLTRTGNRVWCSRAKDPARKLQHSLEMIEVDFGAGPTLVGVNTMHPNRLVEEALAGGVIEELRGYGSVRREVKYGQNSRIDLLLADNPDDPRPCYVEVKNVTLFRQPGVAEFPDAVTSRGAKHLHELGEMVRQGARAVMLFCVQAKASSFKLAEDIDPAYAAAFQQAIDTGVEALVYQCAVETSQINLTTIIR